MKTIYTDKLGLYPWVLLFGSVTSFWLAYRTIAGAHHAPFGLDKNLGGIIFAVIGGYWLFLAARRFQDIRAAKREGRDPTIIRE
jgi:hypothetical protein